MGIPNGHKYLVESDQLLLVKTNVVNLLKESTLIDVKKGLAIGPRVMW